MALDARRKEREQKRNKRMTFVLACIALTFAVRGAVKKIYILSRHVRLGLKSPPRSSSPQSTNIFLADMCVKNIGFWPAPLRLSAIYLSTIFCVDV